VRSKAEGRRVVISVRDHGPGMTDEIMARAFKPVVRGDVGRSDQGGTSIGLAIAKAQAAASKGVSTLQNHPAGGLVASLTFEMVG